MGLADRLRKGERDWNLAGTFQTPPEVDYKGKPADVLRRLRCSVPSIKRTKEQNVQEPEKDIILTPYERKGLFPIDGYPMDLGQHAIVASYDSECVFPLARCSNSLLNRAKEFFEAILRQALYSSNANYKYDTWYYVSQPRINVGGVQTTSLKEAIIHSIKGRKSIANSFSLNTIIFQPTQLRPIAVYQTIDSDFRTIECMGTVTQKSIKSHEHITFKQLTI